MYVLKYIRNIKVLLHFSKIVNDNLHETLSLSFSCAFYKV